MDAQYHLCPGCQQLFAGLRNPETFDSGEPSFFTLHQTFDSFKSAVQAGCKLCAYTRVSCMGHVSDEDFFRAEDVLSADSFLSVFVIWHVLPRGDQDSNGQEEREESEELLEVWLDLNIEPKALPFQPRSAFLRWKLKPISYVPKTCLVKSTTSTRSDLQFFERHLSECLTNHPKCLISHPLDHYPTRLLYVGTKKRPCLRLYSADKQTTVNRPRYTALSHCWGGRILHKLLHSNELEWTRNIPEADLPRTFKEAIQVTRHFGLQFLWIDALCIIQDSADDWSREAAKMADVYCGAYVTIAATGARDSSEGLFPRSRPDIDFVVTVDISRNGAEVTKYALYDPRFLELFLDGEPLCTRGWAVQERILSRRVLHFTSSQMIWECKGQMASQVYPDGFRGMFQSQTQFGESDGSKELSSEASWRRIVSYYSKCQFTMPDDKLVALSGLASYFQPRMGCEYLAGLWTHDLARELLWFTNSGNVFPVIGKRPARYRAPSWSWASLDSPIYFPKSVTVSGKCLVTIEDFGVVPVSEDPRGQLNDGWIDMDGHLIDPNLALDSAGDLIADFTGQWSFTDVPNETSSYSKIESFVSKAGVINQAQVIKRLATFSDNISIFHDTADLKQTFKTDCKDGFCSVWWLPIWLNIRADKHEEDSHPGLSINGLMLQNVPKAANDVFSRVGTLCLHVYPGAGPTRRTKEIGELLDRLTYDEPNLQRQHPELVSRRKIRLV